MQKNMSAAFLSKKSLSEQIWLAYFNATLRSQGIISEAETRRMANKIYSRSKNTPER